MESQQLETTGLGSWAVAWEQSAGADSFGRDRIGASIELPARWELVTSLSSSNTEGSRRKVATVDVDRELPVGTIMWEGRKADYAKCKLKNLYEVTACDKCPDVKSRHSRITLTLTKFKGKLPGAV